MSEHTLPVPPFRLFGVVVLVAALLAAALPAAATPSPAVPAANPSPGDAPAAATVNLIRDGSFEAGTPNPFWQEYSRQFGTPLCSPSIPCSRNLARSGNWFVWFGGSPGAPEHAAITQTVQITAAASLQFYVYLYQTAGFVTDTLHLVVDGTEVWSINGSSSGYSNGYTPVTVDMARYADGQSHAIAFAVDTHDPGLGTSFLLDDVALWLRPHRIMLPLVQQAR